MGRFGPREERHGMEKRYNGGCLGKLMDSVLWIGAMIFLIAALVEYYPFLKNDRDLHELKKEVVQEDKDKRSRKINWKKLKKINPDIIAWIEVPGTKVDYPVLGCHTWNEYLHKDYRGKDNYLGSIFIQPSTHKDFSTFHTVVFGHNMRNQSMFGSLHRFEEKSSYQTTFKSAKEKRQWIRNVRKYQLYSTKIHSSVEDSVITLSTCDNGRGHTARYVVHTMERKVIRYDQ